MRLAATICVAIVLALGAAEVYSQVVVDTESVLVSLDTLCGPKRVYISKLAASGGSGSYEWHYVSGDLPAGMVLQPDGTWAGKFDWDRASDCDGKYVTVEVQDLAMPGTAQATIRYRVRQIDFTGDPSG